MPFGKDHADYREDQNQKDQNPANERVQLHMLTDHHKRCDDGDNEGRYRAWPAGSFSPACSCGILAGEYRSQNGLQQSKEQTNSL